MKLTAFNPYTQAAKDQRRISGRYAPGRSFMFRMCWACQQDKPRQKGTSTPLEDDNKTGPRRFVCLDCKAAVAAKRSAA